MKLLEKLNRVPPNVCRLLARKARGLFPKTNAEIARDAGLARSTVHKISKLKRWDTIPLMTIERYIRGTGVNPLCQWKARRPIVHGKANFMRVAKPSQKRMQERILGEMRLAVNNNR